MIEEVDKEAKEFFQALYNLGAIEINDDNTICCTLECDRIGCKYYTACTSYSMRMYREYFLETYPDLFI